MSSSVFTETPSRRSSLLMVEQSAENDDINLYGEPSGATSDANLVVVIKNDRVHVDSDGLERFIEDKTINSLSVIRITSPTPSMEEDASRSVDEVDRQDVCSSENETSDLEISCVNSGSENSLESAKADNDELSGNSKILKKKEKKVVGIQVENYFLRKDAEMLLKSVMQKSGLIKPKRTKRQELWLQNIMNDHCYTSWDTTLKPSEEQTHATTTEAVKVSFAEKRILNKTNIPVFEEIKCVTKTTKYTDDEDDEQQTSNGEEEEDSEYETENYFSSDTDNDRDSDLDFKVNNNNKKSIRKKRKNIDKKVARRSINVKLKTLRRASNEADEIIFSPVKSRARKPNSEPIMRLHTLAIPLPFAKVQPPRQVEANACKRQEVVRAKHTPKMEKDTELIPVLLEDNSMEIIMVNPNPYAPQRNEKIVGNVGPTHSPSVRLNETVNSPTGPYTDIAPLIEKKSDTKVLATTNSHLENKFVQLEPATVHELPDQISLATHPNRSELAAEADKQLDLINSFVTHELQQSAVMPVESNKVERKIADKSIPAIVKMLEGEDTDTIVVEDNTSLNAGNINAVDLMPPELLDHVTDLLKNDPALQQVVIDDSVFTEHHESAGIVDEPEIAPMVPQIGDIIKLETPVKQEKVTEAGTPFITTMSVCLTSTPIRTQETVKDVQSTPTDDWKQVKLGNGRVISLPPIEAPTTRSRKRAQTTNTTTINQETIESSMSIISFAENESNMSESKNDASLKIKLTTPKMVAHEPKSDQDLPTSIITSRNKKSTSKTKLMKNVNENPLNNASDLSELQGEVDDDDPNKLWCICRKPHGNRFMICCDLCENWFHGKCVGVSSAQGKVLENQNKSWICPQCLKNLPTGVQDQRSTKTKRKRSNAIIKTIAKPLPDNIPISIVNSSHNASLSQFPILDSEMDVKFKALGSKVQTHVTQFLPATGFNEVPKNKTPAQKKIINAFLTEPTNITTVSQQAKHTGDFCLICKQPARNGSIYCSDECIRRYVQNALHTLTKSYETSKANSEKKGLFEEILLMADVKPKVERINVIERKSGNIISGVHAPSISNLKKFLQENPSYEVIFPGSQEANELESKQNKQKPAILNKALVTPIKMTVTKTIVAKETTPPKKIVRQLSNSATRVALSTQKFYKSQESTKDIARTKSDETDKTLKSSASESIVQSESIRENIVKTLSGSLRQRMNNVDDVASFKLKDEEIEKFVHGVEEEMYRYFNGEANSKYKSRYRQLIFNIKDPKNQTLFRKIFYKEVTPVQLAHMSVEELASQELAQWRKQENQHQLDIIKKTELDMMSCSKNLVVKTHKGEEIIDLDHSDFLGMEQNFGVEDTPLLTEPSVPALKVDTFYESVQSSITRKDYGAVILKENEQMKSSFQKSLDSEKSFAVKEEVDKYKHIKDKEKEKERVKTRDRDKEKDKNEKRHKSREEQKLRKRSRSRSRSAERSQDRSDKRHKSTSDRRRDKDKERKRHDDKDKEKERDRNREKTKSINVDKDRDVKDTKDRKHSSSLSEQNSCNKKKNYQKEKNEFKGIKDFEKKTLKQSETFSLIDLIIENTKTVEEAANLVPEKKRDSNENPTIQPSLMTKHFNVQLSPQEPTSTILSPPQDIYARYDSELHTVWSGNLNMVDVASFQIVMKPLFGDSLQVNKLLPIELDVVGRITPDTVWDYISKINQSHNKKIVLVQLLPAHSTETCAYQVLLQYLAKRNRLGVIKTTSPQIKDFYMFPLVTGKRLPPVLEPMEKSPIFEDDERPDMLIGIMIRVFSKRAHQQSGSNYMTVQLPAVNKHRRLGEPPFPNKRHSNLDPSGKDDGFDIDEIIKAPIAGKMGTKRSLAKPATSTISTSFPISIDLDEPYSPGSADDDLPLMPISRKPSTQKTKVLDPEFKFKISELNKQIALQEKEIAGLLHVDQSTTSSNVLANISIPSNLSQILASIKNKTVESTQAQTQIVDSVSSSSTSYQNVDISDAADEEYNPEDDIAYAYSSSKTVKSLASASVTSSTTTSTSRLSALSEAELLSMVPDDMLHTPIPRNYSSKSMGHEPAPPGV